METVATPWKTSTVTFAETASAAAWIVAGPFPVAVTIRCRVPPRLLTRAVLVLVSAANKVGNCLLLGRRLVTGQTNLHGEDRHRGPGLAALSIAKHAAPAR